MGNVVPFIGNEEEKMETINKLLKKQAPKTNRRAAGANNGLKDADATPLDAEPPKANPLYVRWVSGRDGNRIGVPDEWLNAPVGEVLRLKRKGTRVGSGKVIEKVQ